MPPPYPDIVVAQRAAQIEASLADLETSFPDIGKRFIFVKRTQRGRLQSYIKIGDPTRAAERTAVLLVGARGGRVDRFLHRGDPGAGADHSGSVRIRCTCR